MTTETDELERYDAFEEKMEELNDGLLLAYAAGFSKAVESFEIDADFPTDPDSLTDNRALTEAHYYFWDGRVKPLELWLREEFGIDEIEA